MTGVIGAISEFGTYVTSITTVLGSLFAPLLLIAYSKNRTADYRQMTVEGAYIVGLFTGLFCGMLCGSASTLLTLWLGDDFADYGLWMIIKLAVIPYTTAGAMFANSYLYANRNKRPALVSLGLAVLNVGVNVLLLHLVHSVLLFLIVCFVFVILQGLMMNVYMYNLLYCGQLRRICALTLKYTLYMFCVSVFTALAVSMFEIKELVSLICIYLALFTAGIVILDSVFLSKEQRELLFEIVPIYEKARKFVARI